MVSVREALLTGGMEVVAVLNFLMVLGERNGESERGDDAVRGGGSYRHARQRDRVGGMLACSACR
jgi:hypothetical protein